MMNQDEHADCCLKRRTNIFQWTYLLLSLSLFDDALAGGFSLDPLSGNMNAKLHTKVENADIQKYSDFDKIPFNDFGFDKKNEIVINFGAVEVGYPYGPTTSNQCQRKRSTSQKVGIDISLPNEAPTPKFAFGKRDNAFLGVEAFVSTPIDDKANDFFIESGEKLHFGNNLISLYFSPSKIGKRIGVLRTNFSYEEQSTLKPNGIYTIEGKLPVIILIGYGVCPGHDSDGDLLTDDFENQFLGTDIYERDTDNDGLTDDFELVDTGTDPTKWDTDGDGDDDGVEVYINRTKPLDPNGFLDAYKSSIPMTKYGDISDLNKLENITGEGSDTLYIEESQWDNYVSDK